MEPSKIQTEGLRLSSSPLMSEDLLKVLVFAIFNSLKVDQPLNSDLLTKLIQLMSKPHFKDKSIIVPFLFQKSVPY